LFTGLTTDEILYFYLFYPPVNFFYLLYYIKERDSNKEMLKLHLLDDSKENYITN